MTARSQPYRLQYPLTPDQVEALDEMLQLLFDDVRNDSIFPTKTANTVLRVEGDTLEFAKLILTSDVTGILPVANGGSGRALATAYAVICGGTTTTAAHQSVASVGTSGQVLTSNGAGALPTFQASGANFAKIMTRVILGC